MATHSNAVLGGQVPDPTPYGILELDQSGRVIRIIEKPSTYSGQPLVNTGAFAFQPLIFPLLEDIRQSVRGEMELTDVIERLPPEGRCVAVKTVHPWLPVGYPWKLLEVNQMLLEQEITTAPEIPGVEIISPVLVGNETTVSAGCTLGPGTTLGRRCQVGAGTRLVNCLVMDDVRIGADCHLEETVVAEGAVIGKRVRTQTKPDTDAGEMVRSLIKGVMVDTGRSNLGAVIGAGARIGNHCTLDPGVKVWPELDVPEGSHVTADIPYLP